MSIITTQRTTLIQHALPSPTSPPLPTPQPLPTIGGNSALTTTTTPPSSVQVTHTHSHDPIFVEQLCTLQRRRQADMHPDCMLLQAHGVTSPRLSPNISNLISEKQRGNSETSLSMVMGSEMEEVERCEEIESMAEMDVVGGEDDVVEKGEERTITRGLETKAKEFKRQLCDDTGDMEADMETEAEEDDVDAVSLCSEDSELSVGQEEGGRTIASIASGASGMATNFCDFTQQRRLLLSNVGNIMTLCAPSAFSSVNALASSCADGSDARSSTSTDDNNTQAADDESVGSVGTGSLTQQTSLAPPPQSALLSDPYNAVANAMRMPVPVLPRVILQTSSTTPSFQTELMRKSHLYAEELVKQQMQFMAAARASAFTFRHATAGEAVAVAAERRAFARVQGAPTQMSNLVGIQSQLTAITKMSQLSAAAAAAAHAFHQHQQHQQQQQQQLQQHQTSKANLPNSTEALNKLAPHTHLSTNNAAGSVSSLSQLQAQMQAHFPYAHSNHINTNNNNLNNNNNNNLNEPALKFSIDNILKADFGRRLAESAACMAAYNNGTRATKMECGSGISIKNNATQQRTRKTLKSASTPAAGVVTSPIAIDLTHLSVTSSTSATAPSTATLNFSHTLANICTNSSDSNSTAVSSSYGGVSENAKSPVGGVAGVNGADFGAFGVTKGSSSTSAELNAKASDEASGCGSSNKSSGTGASGSGPIVWPAWVYCTRYSDRPSSGRSPRTRKPKKLAGEKGSSCSNGTSNGSGSGGSSGTATAEDKRPRTAFSGSQLARLKHEFTENRYLTEKRRQQLSSELGLNEAQIKIWFQNKRAKLKKSSGTKNPLALQLMAQGLYNHSTIPLTREEEELQELQEREAAAAEVRSGSITTATTIAT